MLLDDVVVSFNPAYYTLVHAFGSETNFLYSLTPRVSSPWTPSPRCFSRRRGPDDRRGDAARRRRRGDTGASLRALALAQWGDCSPLGGASITTLPLPANTLAKFPVAPEFSAYASTACERPRWTPPPPGSPATVGVDDAASRSSDTVLGLLQTSDAVLATSLGVSETHALFVKGYVAHVARRAVLRGTDMMGPFLGPSGYRGENRPRVDPELVDPLTSSRVDPSDPRYLVRAVIRANSRTISRSA